MLNMAEHEIFSANKYETTTTVGIFIFISRENFKLSWVEHEKSFITLGPAQPFHPWVSEVDSSVLGFGHVHWYKQGFQFKIKKNSTANSVDPDKTVSSGSILFA